jgi:Protein of unknown function (DUF992)
MLYPRSAICLAMGALLAASGVQAQSQTSKPQTSIGVLTCTSGAGIEGKGAADNPDLMTCGFKPTDGGAEQRYSGTFKTGAQDSGAPAGKRVWVWSVLGPSMSKMTGNALAQKYVVDARSAHSGVMVLTGESNNAISLQAETAGGAAGVAMEVELKLLTTPA